MRLLDILHPQCIKVPLANATKREAVDELADLLATAHGITAVAELKAAIWQRENARSTGIGLGIAIPHGKVAGFGALRMAIGIAPKPIEYGSLDRKPVDLVILLVSSADQTAAHIQALAKISRMLTDEALRQSLKTAPDAAALLALLEKYEAAHP